MPRFEIFLLFLVTQIFLLSVQHVSPIVVQAVTLPCLKILSQFIKPKPATTKANAVSISVLLSAVTTLYREFISKHFLSEQEHQ